MDRMMKVKKIRQWIREGFRYVRLHSHIGLLPGVPPVDGGDGKLSGIIVAMTTLPGRIDKIFPAINSLIDQTVKPDRIYLSLPSYSRRHKIAYHIPDGLINHPLVKIIPSDRDWGPATKLIPVLKDKETRPETLILAVDDDNIYPRTILSTFLRYARVMPNAALSLRGCHMPASRRWEDSLAFKGAQISKPVKTNIIMGCGGILVKPRFFDEDLFDYDKAPPQAFFVDDIWISGHLARRNIPKYVIPLSESFIYIPTAATFSGLGLDRSENRTGDNNNAMIDYFGDYWDVENRIKGYMDDQGMGKEALEIEG